MQAIKYILGTLCIVLVALLILVTGTFYFYERIWCPQVTLTLVPLPSAAQSLLSAAGAVQGKVAAIDVRPINASLRNVQMATAHVNSITAVVDGKMPEVGKAMFDLWKHTDRTIGHLDYATQQEQDQQKAITDGTIANLAVMKLALTDLDKVVTDPNIPLVISHTESLLSHGDAIAAHGEHVAAHYDKVLTAPKRWYQKLESWAEAAGVWGARHL
jgi:hypothetical protein